MSETDPPNARTGVILTRDAHCKVAGDRVWRLDPYIMVLELVTLDAVGAEGSPMGNIIGIGGGAAFFGYDIFGDRRNALEAYIGLLRLDIARRTEAATRSLESKLEQALAELGGLS